MGISPDRFRLYNKTGSACQAEVALQQHGIPGNEGSVRVRDSAVPTGLELKLRRFPALKRWAKFGRLCGAKQEPLDEDRPLEMDDSLRNYSIAGARTLERVLIIVVLVVCSLGLVSAQIAKKRPLSKGPRAVALIQLADNGRAHLIPVTIMINGNFYDASAYKADPVPMALQPGIVYEAVKAGVSQGLFTVGGAAQANGNWFADGKWVTAEQIAADKEKSEASRKAQDAPKPEEEIGGPPKLKRAPGSSSPDKTPPSSQPPSSSTSSAPPSPPSPSDSGPPPLKRPASASEQKSDSGSSNASSSAADDPNRPVLRRQPVSATTHEQTKASPETEPLKGPVQFIAAVSDADGPEARPYTFKLKPEEQQNFLKKMLAMAGDEVRARSEKMSAASGGEETEASKQSRAPRSSGSNSKSSVKSKTSVKKLGPQPEFHQVEMKAFDVSNTNEAVLVLTASANLPGSEVQYLVALVAREDIYGDLHKVFAHITDNKHLDVLPRYDFIDVVDVDGDGRGELLFRETWDSGTAFAVYRVIGDRLWPLFEGKPGS
jgi:hypothetical protein